MAKSARRARRGRRTSSDVEDDASTIGGSSAAGESLTGDGETSGRSKARAFDIDDWDSTIDRIYGSRPGKRVVSLKWLHQALSTEYLHEQVLGSRDMLISFLTSSIEKGGIDESQLACSCLAAVLLTLGHDELSIGDYEQLQDSLKKAALKGRSGIVRYRAGLCFGILALMGCNDNAYVDEANSWFLNSSGDVDFDDVLPVNAEPDAGLFNGASASAEVSSAEAFSMALLQAEGILHGWTLLASQWRSSLLSNWEDSPTSEFLEFCCRCMTRESPTLRSAAGFALALILEAKWRAADVEDNPQATAALLCELESRHVDVMEHMRELCNGKERNFERGLSKDERKNQKALFRMFLKTAETGEGPSETMCLGSRSRTTNFHSWNAYVRYNIFRHVLRGALACHMVSNPAVIRCVNVYDKRHSSIAFAHTTEMDLTTHSVHEARERQDNHRGRKNERYLQRRAKENLLHLSDTF